MGAALQGESGTAERIHARTAKDVALLIVVHTIAVSANALNGNLSLAQLPAAVVTNNQTGATLNGTFSGNGGSLTNLPTASLTGTVADTNLSANVALLRADWTRHDEAITQALAALGRSGVPAYALYAPGESSPRLLPEVLTPGIVTDALAKLPTAKR